MQNNTSLLCISEQKHLIQQLLLHEVTRIYFGKNLNPYCYNNIIVTFCTFLEKLKKNVWMAKSLFLSVSKIPVKRKEGEGTSSEEWLHLHLY